MNNKGYIFINGYLFKNNDDNKQYFEEIKLDDKYIYSVDNFGASTSFDRCKSFAISDLTTTVLGNSNIIPNSYVAIFETELEDWEYAEIDDDYVTAKFDIWEKINKKNILYSGMYDENKNYIENFINAKELIGGDKDSTIFNIHE